MQDEIRREMGVATEPELRRIELRPSENADRAHEYRRAELLIKRRNHAWQGCDCCDPQADQHLQRDPAAHQFSIRGGPAQEGVVEAGVGDLAGHALIAECEGVANGTLGELVQGQTVAGEDFLVTFPVAFWSKARAVINDSGIVIGPRDKSKARRMASLVLQRLGLASAGAVLEIQCGVPEGKGCASSTADVVAAARAVCDATQLSLEPGEIAELA